MAGTPDRRWSSRAALLVAGALAVASGCGPEGTGADAAAPALWPVDSLPSLVLGASVDDTVQLFEVVIGATRLPDGHLLVADRQEHTLHLYSADGSRLRSFGRRGSGPGEYRYPARFWRCGDSVLVNDIDGAVTSVVSLAGDYVRSFRFGSGAQQPGVGTPYQSSCNAAGLFAHYGWEDLRAGPPPGPVYRSRVPFWLSRADSVVVAVLDSFPGSERVVHFDRTTGAMVGSGPRMFGRQTAIAVGRDRVYIGAADRPAIVVVSLGSLAIDSLLLPLESVPLTPADIAAEKAVRLAAAAPDRRAGIETQFATHPFPEAMPPYGALLVDAEDLLWVQEYPRASAPRVRWWVMSGEGQVRAQVLLPTWLEVFEVGHDYVLGRYLDPIEAVPQVRLYGLRRE